MVYDLSSQATGIRDCPHCRHTMERLKSRLSVTTNEGYLLDSGEGEGEAVAYAALGWSGSFLAGLFRHTLHPLTSKLVGELRTRRLQRILDRFPDSLICRHCNQVIKYKKASARP
jgi:hypothetical protein